jgi:hypothetical protein
MAWVRGVFTPLTQEAIPSGQGLVGISYFFTNGSGNLHLYSDAGLLLGGAMLLLLIVFPRRLGLAVTVMPWLVFYLSTRSQEDYFDLTVPLWVMAAATVSTVDLDRAYHWRPAFLRTRALRTGLVAVLLAPATLCLALAVTSQPPLKITVTGITSTNGLTGKVALSGDLSTLTVDMVNTSGDTLVPHFATSTGATISAYWDVLAGPAELGPHQRARYVLQVPQGSRVAGPSVNDRILLRVVTPTPMSLTTKLIGLGPDPSTVPKPPATGSNGSSTGNAGGTTGGAKTGTRH